MISVSSQLFSEIFPCYIFLINPLGIWWNDVITGLVVTLSLVKCFVSMRGHYSMYYRCWDELHRKAKKRCISLEV